MSKEQTSKLAKHIIRLLKVQEIHFPIGRTNKGNLAIKFDGGEDYEIMLDSIPLSTKSILEDENNIELKKMLDKYLFREPQMTWEHVTVDPLVIVHEKKRGRPAGSKNKK